MAKVNFTDLPIGTEFMSVSGHFIKVSDYHAKRVDSHWQDTDKMWFFTYACKVYIKS